MLPEMRTLYKSTSDIFVHTALRHSLRQFCHTIRSFDEQNHEPLFLKLQKMKKPYQIGFSALTGRSLNDCLKTKNRY